MITVAICTADRYELFSDLLNHLSHQIESNSDYKILIVDSSRKFGQGRQQAEKLFNSTQLNYLRGSESGLSAARNIAVSACTTPFIAFIDDDAIPGENWLKSLLEVFTNEGELCAVAGGRIEPLWLSPRPAWLPDELVGYLSVLNLGSDQHELREDEYLYGTNIAFRLSALKIVGGFRRDLGRTRTLLLSNEEMDLQQRLTTQGFKLVYSPDITVHHKISAERLTQKWFYTRIFWQAISDKIMACDTHEMNPEILDRFKDSNDNPAHLIQKQFDGTLDPDEFFEHCSSIYQNACDLIEEQ